VDVKTALDRVEAQGGTQGLPWLEGRRAGGEGQPPIRVIGDTATAGYNLMLNRAAGDASAPGAALSQERIVELWPSPEALRAWATDVLGEVTVHTGDAPSNTRAGTGLLKQVNAVQSEVQAQLSAIVAGGVPTLADLDKLSAGGIAVTRDLIESIRALAPIERGIVMQKLAAEIALARVMEQALLARRALLAGRREPNISASPAATEQGVLARSIAELDREIEDLVFEARVRREVISDTAQAVLKREEARRARAAGPTEVPAIDPRTVRGGAVPVP
jgi:integrating conjugative element protein (TIGR03755 family)